MLVTEDTASKDNRNSIGDLSSLAADTTLGGSPRVHPLRPPKTG